MVTAGSQGRVVACVSLTAIKNNWRRLADLSGRADTAAVVKANGYGHGLAEVAQALYEAGCRVFFTASIDEACAVRVALQNKDNTNAAMISWHDGLARGDFAAIRDHRLTPSINDPSQLAHLAGLADYLATDKGVPALLQIDTGMNRLGVDWRWLAAARNAESLVGLADWRLVYSHLASADLPSNPQNAQQRQRFDLACANLPAIRKSLAASGGILLGKAYHYDLTRPGIAIYGYPPVAADGFTPALTLKAQVLQIRTLDPASDRGRWGKALVGEAVGYHGSHRVSQHGVTRLATIAGGYADGVRRELSNRGRVQIGEVAAPMVGRVSMDTHVLDITGLGEADSVREGEYVTLFGGAGADAETWAEWSGTIAYEILTGLGKRVEYVYSA